MTDKVMSQEEIDALVGSEPDPLTGAAAPAAAAEAAPAAAAPEAAPAPAAPAAAAPEPAPPPASAIPVPAAALPKGAVIVSGSGSETSDIAQRLTILEATVATLQQTAGGGNDAAVQALTQQVQALTTQLTQLGPQLQNSLGFGLRGTFQCGSCGIQGAVGSRVSCMSCGTESWIGWSEQAA